MIFQHTWRWIIDKSPWTGLPKTSTCRIRKPYQFGAAWDRETRHGVLFDGEDKDRVVYEIGRLQTVMPSRGVKGIRKVADVRIAEIESVDVRKLTEAQVQTEGFADLMTFLALWTTMHDRQRAFVLDETDHLYHQWRGLGTRWGAYTEAEILEHLAGRPEASYDAWYLRFELAQMYPEAIAVAEPPSAAEFHNLAHRGE